MQQLTIESFIEEANEAKSSQEVSELFGKALRNFGYDWFCYSLITDHVSAGLRAGHGIVCNYPADWMDHYRANHYERKDPIPRHGIGMNRPFTWESVLRNGKVTAEQNKIMNEAKEARLHDGIAIPICGQNGELAGVGVASSAGGIQPEKNVLSKIGALAVQFHLVYTELESKARSTADLSVEVQLTDREKEILLWAAEGKSDSIIAEIIGVSHSTIRFHMNNIFKKLNANERTLATVKAIRKGLILPTYLG